MGIRFLQEHNFQEAEYSCYRTCYEALSVLNTVQRLLTLAGELEKLYPEKHP